MKLLAQAPLELGKIEGEGLGPLGKTVADKTDGASGLVGISNLVSSTIGIITVGATIWFMFQLIIGGINWLASGGDKTKLQEARDRITNAFVGLVIVMASWGIIAILGAFFGGFDILIADPKKIIDSVMIKKP